MKINLTDTEKDVILRAIDPTLEAIGKVTMSVSGLSLLSPFVNL